MQLTLPQVLSVFLSLLLVLPSTWARAATKPTVLVAPMEGGEGNRRARSALISSFRETGQVNVIEEDAVDRYLEDRNASSQGHESPSDGTQKLKSGIKAYRALKIDQAISHLELAKKEFREHLVQAEDFQALRATQMYLAMTYLAKKNRQRAKDEITEAILLDPGREKRKLPSKHYSPAVRKLFREVLRQIMEGEHGDLEVTSLPSGAVVYVDGKSIGASPVRVRELPAGEHFLRVEAEGRKPYMKAVTIIQGENRIPVELPKIDSVDLEKMFSILPKADQISPKRSAFLDEMGIGLGADILVFLAPSEGSVKGQLYDLRSQEISVLESGSSPQELVNKLSKHMDSDGYVIPPKTELSKRSQQTVQRQNPPIFRPAPGTRLSDQATHPMPKTSPTENQWYKNKWIWIGVGAVLATGAGVFLLTDLGKKGATTSTINVTIP